MITTEQKAQMLKMRKSGLTLQQIGNAFGVSRQDVCEIVNRPRLPRENLRNIIYPFLREWMIKRGLSVKKLSAMVGMTSSTLSERLNGKRWFRQNEIEAILELTGKTYEEVFSKEERKLEAL